MINKDIINALYGLVRDDITDITDIPDVHIPDIPTAIYCDTDSVKCLLQNDE